MPFDIAALRKRGVDVEVDVFGEKLTVTYDPLTVGNPKFREHWGKAQGARVRKMLNMDADDTPKAKPKKKPKKEEAGQEDAGPTTDQMVHAAWTVWAEACCKLIIGWDVVIDGEPVPIEPETFLGSGIEEVFDEDGYLMRPKGALLTPDIADLISKAIWKDYQELGNPRSSTNSSNGSKPKAG